MRYLGKVAVLGLLMATMTAPDPATAQYKGTIQNVVCTLRLTDFTAPTQRFATTEVLGAEFEYSNPADENFVRTRSKSTIIHNFYAAVQRQQPEIGPFPDSGYADCTFFGDNASRAADHVREMKSRPGYIPAIWDGRSLAAQPKPATAAKPAPVKPVPVVKPKTAAPAKPNLPPGTIVYSLPDPNSAPTTAAQREQEAAERARTQSLNAEQLRRAQAAKQAEEDRLARITAERQAAHRAQIERQQAEYRAKLAAQEAETARIRAEWAERAARCKAGDKKACASSAAER